MTAPSKLDEARLRDLATDLLRVDHEADEWPLVLFQGRLIHIDNVLKIASDALSAERERGGRAVENSMCRIDMDGDTDLLDDLAISGDHIKLLRLEDMGEGFWGRVYMHDGSDIVLSIGAKRSRVSVIVERELATQKAEGA